MSKHERDCFIPRIKNLMIMDDRSNKKTTAYEARQIIRYCKNAERNNGMTQTELANSL